VQLIIKENWGSNAVIDPNVEYKVYVGLPQVLFFAQGSINIETSYATFTTCN
jgi:hypothetical protein